MFMAWILVSVWSVNAAPVTTYHDFHSRMECMDEAKRSIATFGAHLAFCAEGWSMPDTKHEN